MEVTLSRGGGDVSDFRKKLFRGAKIEDLIVDLDALVINCEEIARRAGDLGKQRFYEGMAVAYQIMSQKLKGQFEYMDTDVIDHLYKGVEQFSAPSTSAQSSFQIQGENGGDQMRKCSFCGRGHEEGVRLVPGPGVAICNECVDFARDVIHQTDVTEE